MKLEIELDLNRIDYDAINKQIHEKIDNMDLHTVYKIDSKINYMIEDKIKELVGDHLTTHRWSNVLNDTTKDRVSNELRCEIHKTIDPVVDEIFKQIPTEDLSKMIIDLMPKVLMDLLYSYVSGAMNKSFYVTKDTILKEADSRVRAFINR